MGTRLIIKGADFSSHPVEETPEEKVMALLNANAANIGITTGTSNTGIYNIFYNAGFPTRLTPRPAISLDALLTAMGGATKLKIIPINDYRFSFAVGNSTTSQLNLTNQSQFLDSEQTIDFTNISNTDYTELQDVLFILMVVQKASDTSEQLGLDFSNYLDFEIVE